MATFAQMKIMVAAYMQRSTTEFTISSIDLLAKAINSARRWAEMQRSFELNRVQAQLSISLANGADISGMTLAGTATPVICKSLIKGFLTMPDAATATFPIDIITRDKHLERVQRHYATVTNITTVSQRQPSLVPFFVIVRVGNTLYITPNDASVLNNQDPVTVKFDIYKFLPDYSADSDTDFLLDRGEEFMLYRSCFNLNFYLKDDQRVPVSEEMLRSAWDAVVRWDANLIEADTADANLD